ncbi:hypothetical protein [Accumulibacter sp.]|uniref:hypothetical protein n=1 Tax=Accumulibacter sp. TaxID=2053492 RepID=UPI0028C43C7E|nr:hypothetical protein [Accumulibacter sp.]
MSRYLHPVTPAEVSRELASLCASLAPSVEPIYVSAKPIEGAPANECFPLVEATVSREGGDALFGWSLWEFPGVFVEAEFHVVWSSPTEELIDVTPKNHSVGRILFLPSKDAVYSGRQINNIRRSISNDPCVTEYFATFDREFELINRGARADQHGEIKLTNSEADEYNSIKERQALLFPQILSIAAPIGAYTPCPCNSGKKVRWCHGVKNVG